MQIFLMSQSTWHIVTAMPLLLLGSAVWEAWLQVRPPSSLSLRKIAPKVRRSIQRTRPKPIPTEGREDRHTVRGERRRGTLIM